MGRAMALGTPLGSVKEECIGETLTAAGLLVMWGEGIGEREPGVPPPSMYVCRLTEGGGVLMEVRSWLIRSRPLAFGVTGCK